MERKEDTNQICSQCKEYYNHGLHSEDNGGNTAFMYIVRFGHLKCLRSLLSGNKVDVNKGNKLFETPLMYGAQYGHLECVQALVSAGAHVDVTNANGSTALMYASLCGHHHCVRALISLAADVNIQNINQDSALSLAVLNGSVECVKLLLDAKADVKQIYSNGNSVLHLACMNTCKKFELLNKCSSHVTSLKSTVPDGCDTAEITQALIAAGADVNARNKMKTTPIMMAVGSGKVECTKLLIKELVVLWAADSECNTVLHHAVIYGSAVCLNLIINKCVSSLEATNNKNETPLMLAHLLNREECARCLVEAGAQWNVQTMRSLIRSSAFSVCKICVGEFENLCDLYALFLVEATRKKHIFCMYVLLLAGSDVDQVDEVGMTSLLIAASNGQLTAVKSLLESGANVNKKCLNGRTAIFIAACHGNVEMTKYLINNHADIEITNNDGYSPLFAALLQNKPECMKLLINAEAKWDIEKNKRHTIHKVSFKGCSDCVNVVDTRKKRARIRFGTNNPLTRAIIQGHSHCVYALLLQGHDISLADPEGMTPLMVSMVKNKSMLAGKLLENGANLNAQCNEGKTALMYAAELGHSKCLAIIPAGNLQTEIVDRDGNTALNLAAEHGRVTCVKLILELGADVNSANNKGVTPLMNGVHRKGCIRHLLAAGADVNRTTHDGETALIKAANCWLGMNYLDLLLRKCADVNARDHDGRTALSHADSYTAVSNLLRWKADSNLPDKQGITPVIYIASNSYIDLMTVIEHGGDPDQSVIPRSNFRSILGRWNLERIQIIVSSGAFPKISDAGNDTETPLMMAIQQNKLDVARYFLSNNYLTTSDTKPWLDPTVRRDITYESKRLFNDLYSQPWPLTKLALISISTAIGPSPGRKDRIRQLPLPARIQRMLMFEELTSKICVTQWRTIDLCFSQTNYENPWAPKPKLYFWPFLKNVEKFECSRCQHPCYKFAE